MFTFNIIFSFVKISLLNLEFLTHKQFYKSILNNVSKFHLKAQMLNTIVLIFIYSMTRCVNFGCKFYC